MTAWFFCPYKTATLPSGEVYRYCAAEDFAAQIRADGGGLAYGEILGDHGIAKVNASPAAITAMDAAVGFVRIPGKQALSDPLSDLTAGQKTAIVNKLLALGFTAGQLQAALGADVGTHTLGDVLRFALTRWRRPAAIVGGVTQFDGVDFPRGAPRSLLELNAAVS